MEENYLNLINEHTDSYNSTAQIV
ncbi:hypothetical protein CAJAP_09895 [Camponotus japonicus]